MPKEIVMNRGYIAIVDDEDYEWLNQWKWTCFESHGQVYARRTIRISSGKNQTIMMHRLITNAPKGMEVDHRDCNGLNNQRGNLRVCTHSQNSGNSKKFSNGKTSQYKGVCWLNDKQKWHSTITCKSVSHWVGYFYSEMEAAKAYDIKALELFGEFALLNFPNEIPPLDSLFCQSAKVISAQSKSIHAANPDYGILCGAASGGKKGVWEFTNTPQNINCKGCLRVIEIQGERISLLETH